MNNRIVWGFDDSGDFGFTMGDSIHVFYKWHDATTIPKDQCGFTELTDANSKNLWRKIQSAVEEFKEENGM